MTAHDGYSRNFSLYGSHVGVYTNERHETSCVMARWPSWGGSREAETHLRAGPVLESQRAWGEAHSGRTGGWGPPGLCPKAHTPSGSESDG